MIKLKGNLEYLIISSCNLDCTDCDRFSNYNLPYHVSLEAFEEDVKKWGKKLRPDSFTLQGGEPTLHPHLSDLIRISRKYINTDRINTFTNGTLLHKRHNHNLIEALFDVQPSTITVSIHLSDKKSRTNILKNIKKYLLKDYSWSRHTSKKLMCEDVTVKIDDFTNDTGFWMPYNNIVNGVVKPYTDDRPDLSYERCGAKMCSAMYKGRLYKCPRSALLKDFLKSENLFNDPSWDAYKNISGISHEDDLQNYSDNKHKYADVCGMCPAYELAKPQTGVSFK